MQSARPRRSLAHWLLLLTALSAPLALLALGRALEPDPRGYGTHEQLGFEPCMPMERWNLPCPACGVTTALALAGQGFLLRSLSTQPLGLALLAASLAGAIAMVYAHARGRDLARELRAWPWRALTAGLATCVLLAWLYKIILVRALA